MKTCSFVYLNIVILVVVVISSSSIAAESSLATWWKFDETRGNKATEQVSGASDAIGGNFRQIEGVSESGLKFDGFTTRIDHKAENAPVLVESFTICAWVAPQAYPWNYCATVDRHQDESSGYYFGIGDTGQIKLALAIDGKWVECVSETRVDFMKYSHVAGVYEKGVGLTVYINGESAGGKACEGEPIFDNESVLRIGRNIKKLPPSALVREDVSFESSYSFDGIIDELKIYSKALSAGELKAYYKATKPDKAPALKWRKLPRLFNSAEQFGAFYTRLKFYPEWDDLWRVADHPDIVVTFDEGTYSMVFWRGTNYNMNLVTENGKWVADQSAEEGSRDTVGCCEHMSDKQCRYAHVRLIENNDARVVVHWRYALCDVLYRISSETQDGRGVWADEYYHIYPDGVAVRSWKVYNVGGCSITEPASLNQPGEKAEDNLETEAVILANMQGQVRGYKWDPWPGTTKGRVRFKNPLPNANICVVNFKSEYKPYYIYEPGTKIIPYGGGLAEIRNDYSNFPTWNHWPVCQMPSDGRYALTPDRVSSSAVTSPAPSMEESEDGTVTGCFIMGLGNMDIKELVPLAKSWLQSPELTITSGPYKSLGYDRNQRAHIFSQTPDIAGDIKLNFTVFATEDNPIVNPAFVIKNWGDIPVRFTINDTQLERGANFRYGYNPTLTGTDLIVWLKTVSQKPMQISIMPEHRL